MTTAQPGIDIAASHRHRIGCSKIAQALGLSRFGTRLELWEHLTGRREPPDLSNDLRVALGEPMEQVLRPFAAQRLGRELRRDRREYRHPTLPLVGHVDYRAEKLAGESTRPVVDMKTSLGFGARHRFGEDGTDEVDDDVLLQMQGYCLLTGASDAFVVALTPGPELKVYTIHADRELAQMIEDGIRDFWRLVETDTPPDPASEAEARALWTAHRPGAAIELAEEDAESLRELARLKAEIREREKQEEALRDRLIPRFGDAEVITFQGAPLATFKANKPSVKTDWKALADSILSDFDDLSRQARIEPFTVNQPGARVLRFTREIAQ